MSTDQDERRSCGDPQELLAQERWIAKNAGGCLNEAALQGETGKDLDTYPHRHSHPER